MVALIFLFLNLAASLFKPRRQRLAMCVGDEAIDDGLEIVDGSEDTALEAPKNRELGQEAP
jgi:hypothetical protein